MSRLVVAGLAALVLALPCRAAPPAGSPSGQELRYLLPNLEETPGTVETSAHATDSRIHVVYGGDLPETAQQGRRAHPPIVTDGSLYVYGADSKPLRSATGVDVCNPCAFSVSSAERKRTLALDDLVMDAGGPSPTSGPSFAVLVLRGSDLEEVSVTLQILSSNDEPAAACSCGGGGSSTGHTGHVTLMK